MKQIKTAGKDLIVVEVPEDCKYNIGISTDYKVFGDTNNSSNWTEFSIQLPDGEYKILGVLSELSEEDSDSFVFEYSSKTNTFDKSGFQNYLYTSSVWSFSKFKFTAKESLISLLQSNNIDTSKELLLIEVL